MYLCITYINIHLPYGNAQALLSLILVCPGRRGIVVPPPVPRASCLLVPGRQPDLAAGAKLGQSQERGKAAPKGPRFPLIKRLFSRAARPSSRSIPLPFRPRQSPSEAEQIFPADACRSDRRGNNWQLRPRDQGDTD